MTVCDCNSITLECETPSEPTPPIIHQTPQVPNNDTMSRVYKEVRTGRRQLARTRALSPCGGIPRVWHRGVGRTGPCRLSCFWRPVLPPCTRDSPGSRSRVRKLPPEAWALSRRHVKV